MSIRAKLTVTSVTKTDFGAEVVKLEALYGDGEGNKSFSVATPTASLSMQIDNTAAHGFFREGKEYFLDFTPVPPAEEVAPAPPVPPVVPPAATQPPVPPVETEPPAPVETAPAASPVEAAPVAPVN